MKKQILALSLGLMSLGAVAQKSELKEADKTIEGNKTASTISEDNFSKIFKPGSLRYMCKSMLAAIHYSDTTSYQAYVDKLLYVTRKAGYDVKNVDKFISDNSERLTCKNPSMGRFRERSSILKFTVDAKRYDFIREILKVQYNGKVLCNSDIDLKKVEIVDGENESLLDFVDKLIATPIADAIHDPTDLKLLRSQINKCMRQ